MAPKTSLHAVGNSGLPDFVQPPVDETALSLQFSPIAGFGIPHFGLYWTRMRVQFPNFEVKPPIQFITERFEPGARMAPQVGVTLVEAPEIRCWFLDQTKNWLLQLQRDRFVHNWRKVTGTEEYPRYPTLRASLAKQWDEYCNFLKDENFEQPRVNQCEVTYVNNIEYGRGWNSYGELERVIASLAAPKSKARFLPDPERQSMQVTYRLENDAGRLHVAFVPVIRSRDGKEVLQMTLTARGAPKSSSIDDVFEWLDLGRKWVVRGFADFTTKEMHEIWGKK